MLPPLCLKPSKGHFIKTIVKTENGNQVENYFEEKCDRGCETCENSSSNCTKCIYNIDRDENCKCMIGYHDDSGSL